MALVHAQFNIGQVITNGMSAGRVVGVETDATWKASGLRLEMISLEGYGGNVGMTSFVPDYLLGSWSTVPFEWKPAVGGGLEERYVWRNQYRHLERELRKAAK